MTFPSMEESPTTLSAKLLLSGVKTMLKRLAENVELLWHSSKAVEEMTKMQGQSLLHLESERLSHDRCQELLLS